MHTLLDGPAILSTFDPPELVYYGDGAGGIISVMKMSDAIGNDTYSMVNSGKVDASNRGDMQTQTLLAHIPMLFHEDARTVMVLGLASGITAGEVLHYPVEEMDILEISREVVTGCDYFLRWNNNVMTDPRTRLIIQDGRAHLELTNRSYDVIISEPSNPWMAGMATLFTKEFFSLARDRLTDDGIFVQFTHSYQMDWETFALIGRTFADVFPNSVLINTAPSATGPDYILVGIKGQAGLDLDIALTHAEFLRKSSNLRLTDPRLFYRQIITEDLGSLFGQGAVNSDNMPILEFGAPRVMHENDPRIEENIRTRKKRRAVTDSLVALLSQDVDAQIEYAAYAFSLYTPFQNMVDLTAASESQKNRYIESLEDYCLSNMIEFSLIDDPDLRMACWEKQAQSILDRIDDIQNKSAAYFHVADYYFNTQRYDSTAYYYGKGLEFAPDAVAGHHNLGLTFDRLGDISRAQKHYLQALEIRPGMPKTNTAMGELYIRLGNLEKAEEYLSKAISLDPDLADPWVNLSVVYSARNDFAAAMTCLEKAISLRPDLAVARYNYSLLLTQAGRVDEAITQLSAVVKMAPTFVRAQYDLGIAFLQKRDWKNAIVCFKNTLSLTPDMAMAHFNLGVALVEDNDPDAATVHFEETLRLDPTYGPAREKLNAIRDMNSGN
jgi:spermidine synthase